MNSMAINYNHLIILKTYIIFTKHHVIITFDEISSLQNLHNLLKINDFLIIYLLICRPSYVMSLFCTRFLHSALPFLIASSISCSVNSSSASFFSTSSHSLIFLCLFSSNNPLKCFSYVSASILLLIVSLLFLLLFISS